MATINVVTSDDPTLGRGVLNAGAGESINVRDLGAVGDGVTDDYAAFQAASDAAAAAFTVGKGATEVYIPPGEWSLGSSTLAVASGVTLRGDGQGTTTITSSNASSTIQLTGASDYEITGLTVESTDSGTGACCLQAYYNGLLSRVTITGCRFTGATRQAIRFDSAVEFLTVRDNIIEDSDAGFTLLAPLHTGTHISTQISIVGNKFRNVGHNNLQFFGPGPGHANGWDNNTIENVEISGNDLRDFADGSTAIPMEPTGINNLSIIGNVIEGEATNGISLANCRNVTVTGNVVNDQTSYGVELNGGEKITVVGNTFQNCASLAMETGYSNRVVLGNGGIDLADVVIADNVYTDGRQPSGGGGNRQVIRIVNGKRIRITGNVITDWEYIISAVKVGVELNWVDGGSGDMSAALPVPQDVVVDGNTFTCIDANTSIRAVDVHAAKRTNVTNNVVRIERDLVAAELNAIVIGVQMDPDIEDTLIEYNHIQFTGNTTAGSSVGGIGNHPATAAACAGLAIYNNHVVDGVYGVFTRTTSTDCIAADNMTSTCSAGNSYSATTTAGPGGSSAPDIARRD